MDSHLGDAIRMPADSERQPGDRLLSHYLPGADDQTRERARAAFRNLAFLMMRIGERLELAGEDTGDSTKIGEGATISQAPTEP